MSTSAPAATGQQKEVKKSSTCTNCRERHLKCDGGPICSRCKTERTACIFVASRRGQRKPTSNARRHELEGGFGRDGGKAGRNQTIWTTPIVSGGKPPDFSTATEDRPLTKTPAGRESTNQLERSRTATSVHLLGLFYSFFFHTHPFVLPRAHLSEKFAKNESPQLQAAVEYLGACYDPTINQIDYLEAANRRLLATPPKDGYTVQALLLFGIGLHASNEKERALEIVKQAVKLALDLGMHLPEFASKNGTADRVLEESWRRTFWELYIVERVLAAQSATAETIQITHATIDVPLPCEENEYLAGHVFRHRTLEDYDNRTFLADDITFPSYAYQIDAARILAHAIPLALSPTPDEVYIEKVDHELGQWCLYLPEEKRTLSAKDGVYDEVLFHAHALMFCASMFLHRPRSYLAAFRFHNPILDCYPTLSNPIPSPVHSAAYHTAFLIRAADNLGKLVTIPRNALLHTPLFHFCLLMSASTYLATWPLIVNGQQVSSPGSQGSKSPYQMSGMESGMVNGYPSSGVTPPVRSFTFRDERNNTPTTEIPFATVLGIDQAQIKEQIRLEVSAFKKISQVWPCAKSAMDEIRSISMQFFTVSTPPKSSPGSDAMTDSGHSTRQPSVGIPIHPTMIPPSMPTLPQAIPGMSQLPNHFESSSLPLEAMRPAELMPMDFSYSYSDTSNVYGSYGSDGSLTFGYGRSNHDWDGPSDITGMSSG